MKLGKSGEGFFVKNFAADEQPLNPLSPVTSPPDSPRSSSTLSRIVLQSAVFWCYFTLLTLERTTSALNSSKRTRRSFHRSKSDLENNTFDPSCALSDSEVDFVNHRPAKESKSGKTKCCLYLLYFLCELSPVYGVFIGPRIDWRAKITRKPKRNCWLEMVNNFFAINIGRLV